MADAGPRELTDEAASPLEQNESVARPLVIVTAYIWQGCQARFAAYLIHASYALITSSLP
jgi:hypothetical protein